MMTSWKSRTGLLVTSALATTAAAVGGLAVATGTAGRVAQTAADWEVAQMFDPAYLGRRVCGVDGKARSQFFKPGLFVSVANAAET